jgi:2-keto-3-deoxy-L-rhamnonate aldolase RhmA
MMRRLVLAGAVLLIGTCGAVQAQQTPKVYNTAKQKLLDGKQVVGGTVFSPDPAMYCAMANAGFDFLWIEMQHSPLTYQDVARMVFACRGSAGMPFIRVPKYPPFGRRSQGGGQYRELWGNDYRQTANDNMMVVIMIETPEGVANAEKIAAVPGIDVIFAASTDLGNFSGYKQGEPQYEALVTGIKDATLARGIKLGGPLAWKDRPGFSFFQGPGESVLINAGAQVILKNAPAPATR